MIVPEALDISREPQASLEELLAPIILYLSSDVIHGELRENFGP